MIRCILARQRLILLTIDFPLLMNEIMLSGHRLLDGIVRLVISVI